MRILLDARYLDGTYSGIATYSLQMIEHLARVDQENSYYVLVRPGFQEDVEVGANFEFLSYRPRPISLATMLNLGPYVDALKVDLMHSFFPLAPLFMRTPLVVTMHDLQPLVDPDFHARRPFPLQWTYGAFYRWVYPAVVRRARWVITVSHHTRDLLAELVPESRPKLFAVPSGLEPEIHEPLDVQPDEVIRKFGVSEQYLLYYGSTRPNKNLPRLVQGFAGYLRENDDQETELVMVLKRDRFFRDVHRAMKHEGIKDRVRVINQVDPTERRALLAGARAFVFPTKYEGFGFPALEAMAAGVPVLAGESGALPEICGEAAELVDPDDAESIAEGIRVLLASPERRRILREKGRQRCQQFDWKDTAERVRDLYNLLM